MEFLFQIQIRWRIFSPWAVLCWWRFSLISTTSLWSQWLRCVHTCGRCPVIPSCGHGPVSPSRNWSQVSTWLSSSHSHDSLCWQLWTWLIWNICLLTKLWSPSFSSILWPTLTWEESTWAMSTCPRCQPSLSALVWSRQEPFYRTHQLVGCWGRLDLPVIFSTSKTLFQNFTTCMAVAAVLVSSSADQGVWNCLILLRH